MSFETTEDEIGRLEAERHTYSATFANTSESDAVTRAHLQEEMDARTARIRELQQEQPLGFFARWTMRAAAGGAAWGAWEVDWLWARIALAVIAAALAFFSLG